jgi:hypothetical protein
MSPGRLPQRRLPLASSHRSDRARSRRIAANILLDNGQQAIRQRNPLVIDDEQTNLEELSDRGGSHAGVELLGPVSNALRHRHLDPDDARLILLTRLADVPLRRLATDSGRRPETMRRWRRAAEARVGAAAHSFSLALADLLHSTVSRPLRLAHQLDAAIDEVEDLEPRRAEPLRRTSFDHPAVGTARLLAGQPPRRIRMVLSWLRRGAQPATLDQTKAARDAVVAVSLACAGREGCLPRSLATVLLCRLRGQWATWCVGARRLPPFGAHAWVEAEGVPVGEDYPADYFRTFFRV